jgi:predicted DNA-binding protein
MTDQKEVQFGIRVPDELKQAFVDTCKRQDSTASREIRAFMVKYIKEHGQRSLF